MQKQKLWSLNVFVPKISVQVTYTEDVLTTLAFCGNRIAKFFLMAYFENHIRFYKLSEAFFSSLFKV